ncbi:hypothetical protein ACFE04_015597 [Oxalis oulophora]
MWNSPSSSQTPIKQQKKEREWFAASFKPENFLPGLIIGFIVGLLMDLADPLQNQTNKKKMNFSSGKLQQQSLVSSDDGQDLKMVLVVRRDLKMGSGKIAAQCAHAATGMYAELMQSDRSLLRQWEQCGQAKIVVTCKNQQDMIKLRESADSIGLPTFVVADAGKTQVAAGSKTVLAVGPVYHALDSCLSSTVKYLCRDLIRIVLAIFNRRNADSCNVKHVFIR